MMKVSLTLALRVTSTSYQIVLVKPKKGVVCLFSFILFYFFFLAFPNDFDIAPRDSTLLLADDDLMNTDNHKKSVTEPITTSSLSTIPTMPQLSPSPDAYNEKIRMEHSAQSAQSPPMLPASRPIQFIDLTISSDTSGVERG